MEERGGNKGERKKWRMNKGGRRGDGIQMEKKNGKGMEGEGKKQRNNKGGRNRCNGTQRDIQTE